MSVLNADPAKCPKVVAALDAWNTVIVLAGDRESEETPYEAMRAALVAAGVGGLSAGPHEAALRELLDAVKASGGVVHSRIKRAMDDAEDALSPPLDNAPEEPDA